jgi:enediyne biosynthesis protein E4
MNFNNFRFKCFTICFILFPFTLLAQINDTESPDTSWFTDITKQVGLNFTNVEAVIAVDVNNDDYPDLIFINQPQVVDGLSLYINEERPGSTNPHDRIFVNKTLGSGLNTPGLIVDLAGATDFDNDGNVDLLVNTWWQDSTSSGNNCVPNPNPAHERLRILWGHGDGTFTLDTFSNTPNSGLEALGPLAGTGLPALDYDRDGYLDFFVACHFHNWCSQVPESAHLMHNNGNRTFTDVSEKAGINVSQKDPSKPWLYNQVPTARALFGANVFDWNNDGLPDIFTCPYEATGYPFDAKNNQYSTAADTEDTRGYGNLYKNNGNGTFTDVGITENWDPHFAWSKQGMVPWSAMPADYNNDGNMDFLAVIVHGGNNDTVAPYNTPTSFPGDGRTCIFTNLGPDSGYRFKPDVGRIHRNKPRNVTYGDHTGCWSDFNNDGYQDLMIGDAAYNLTSRGFPDYQRMFFELQDTLTHNFYDITAKLGLCDSITDSILHKIRRPATIIPVDFDLDGDDDIIKCPYVPSTDSVLFLRNNVGNRNNHITIKLIAPKGVNKSCIGARITVISGNLKQTKEIYGDQGSWTNEYPFIQSFGLGKRTIIDTIDVRWPNAKGTHTILKHVKANQFIKID